MTIPRAEQIDLEATTYYHCMTRCVRQSYLCGEDKETHKNYNHRKAWIVNRLKHLASVFSIKVCAYAVMSNHYHLVLYVDLAQAKEWSEEEVQAHWGALFPRDAKTLDSLSPFAKIQKIALWRERLISISWFMRCLNEVIARFSNKEEDKKGRFWEGRFKCQALLDEGALLSAMAYVDLNPIRAKVAHSPENAEFTSIYERIQAYSAQQQSDWLMPLNPTDRDRSSINFNLPDYLTLVDETGKVLREDKPGVIPAQLSPILSRLNLNSTQWSTLVKSIESNFSYAVGHTLALLTFSTARKGSPKGIMMAKKCYLNQVA